MVSSWHDFVRSKRTGTKRTLQELGETWAGMTADEKNAFQPRPVPANLAEPPQPRASLWPNWGDVFYPISIANMQGVSERVGPLNTAWRDRIGNGVIGPRDRWEAPVEHLCGETFGFISGRCATLLPAEDVRGQKAWKAHFRTWCRLVRPAEGKVDGTFSPVGLLYLGPAVAPAAGAADRPPGRLVACLYADLGTVFEASLCMQDSLPISVGDVIDLELTTQHLCDHQKATRTALHQRVRILRCSRFGNPLAMQNFYVFTKMIPY